LKYIDEVSYKVEIKMQFKIKYISGYFFIFMAIIGIILSYQTVWYSDKEKIPQKIQKLSRRLCKFRR